MNKHSKNKQSIDSKTHVIYCKGEGIISPLALKKWEFEIWGCTDGDNISCCKKCKLNKWECHVFKDTTNHEFLYTAKGDL